jgi:hypothetical protein
MAAPGSSPDAATVIIATNNAGRSWKAQRVPGAATAQLSGVSCPTVKKCMAVGTNGPSAPGSGVVLTTSDAGKTWTPAPSPPGALTVNGVVCTSASYCIVIVSTGTLMWSATTTTFGQAWQQAGNIPSPFLGGDNLSCTFTGVCLVAGYVPTGSGQGQGAVAISSDGGHTWALASVPTGTGLLQSAACVSTSVCLAAGTATTSVGTAVPAHGELLRSIDGGHTWAPSASGPPPVDDVYDVACPSAKVCAMVGTRWVGSPAVASGAVAQSGDGGQTFRSSPAAYVPLSLTALSCPTAAACVAVGGDTVAQLTLLPPESTPSTTGSDGSTGT